MLPSIAVEAFCEFLVNDSHLWPKIDGVDAVNMVKILDDFVQKFELKNKLALFWVCFVPSYVDGLVLGVDNLKQMEENVEMFKSFFNGRPAK